MKPIIVALISGLALVVLSRIRGNAAPPWFVWAWITLVGLGMVMALWPE